MYIDTHTHLYDKVFDADRDKLITKAINAGVGKFYMPNIDLSTVEQMMALAARYPGNCLPMMGLHPCHVNAGTGTELEQICRKAKEGVFRAIGEIGIDLHWDKTTLGPQKDAFSRQVQLAVELGLPIVIHTRESFEETISVLETFTSLPRGIFHCFTGSIEQARQIIALGGFKLGIGGVLTFKNGGLDKVVGQLGLEHLVLETDAPYLAPAPFRGKRNEPVYLLEIAKRLAEVTNTPIHEVEERTSANAREVFGDW